MKNFIEITYNCFLLYYRNYKSSDIIHVFWEGPTNHLKYELANNYKTPMMNGISWDFSQKNI